MTPEITLRGETAMAPDRLVGLAAALYGGMLAIALLWGLLRGLTPGWWTFGTEAGPGIAVGVGAGVGLGLAGVALSSVLDGLVDGVRKLTERFAAVLAGVSAGQAILLALFSAVGEEILFRGCFQAEWGLVPATILFAAVHIGPERVYLWWTASAFTFGVGLGLLYIHGGGLLAPMLMHFVINAINISLLGRRGRDANGAARRAS